MYSIFILQTENVFENRRLKVQIDYEDLEFFKSIQTIFVPKKFSKYLVLPILNKILKYKRHSLTQSLNYHI